MRWGALLTVLLVGCASSPRAPAPTPAEPAPVDEDALRLEEEPPPDRARAESLVDEGRRLRDQGDMLGALGRLDDARSEDDSYGIAHLEWAITAQLAAAPGDEVSASFERAVALLEENPRAHFERAAFHESQGRLSIALEGYERTLALRSDHKRARQAYARALLSADKPGRAKAQYAGVVARDPRNVAALLGLATAAERTGDLEQAEGALRDVVKLYPKVAGHRRRLIAFYERTEQPKKARREEKKLERVDPQKKRRLRSLKPSRRKRKK
jgi:tetratricopeptide (TPR) repeat protein